MKISLADHNDLDAVTSIVKACITHMDSKGIRQWDTVYPNREVLEQDISRQSLFVIQDGDIIIGAMVLNEHQEPEYGDMSWEHPAESVLVVHRLCVYPNSQGQGVASRLMDFAEQHAESGGYEAIRLDAFTMNPAAVSLYERRGYRNAGTVMFRKGSFYCFEKKVENKEGSNKALLNDAVTHTRER